MTAMRFHNTILMPGSRFMAAALGRVQLRSASAS
jgi:hypothetical protein